VIRGRTVAYYQSATPLIQLLTVILDMRTFSLSLLLLSGMAFARTRHYTLDIGNSLVAPDGFQRSAVTVNGNTPGPVLIASKGDKMIVNVKNSLAVIPPVSENVEMAVADFPAGSVYASQHHCSLARHCAY
jgi:FtsP/CotA-like multicopper oxidase with cupredoxin domain